MKNKGFTFIEILITLFIFSVLAAIAAPILYRQVAASREENALSRLETLKKAIVGDPSLVSKGERTDFGYLGDWGGLPDSLMDLIDPKTPGWQVNVEKHVGAGWDGPYMEIDPDDLIYSPWGDEYVYSTVDYVNENGLLVDAVLISYGEDRVASDDDQKVEILKSETTADRVRGYVISKYKEPIPDIQVAIYYAVNGSITEDSVVTNNHGYYEFSDIPFGVSAIFFNTPGVGGLFYVEDSGRTYHGGDDLRFAVKSNMTADITITWMILEYSANATYEWVEVDEVKAWEWDGVNRAGSGTVIPFDPVLALGGGSSIRLSVASPDVYVRDTVDPVEINYPVIFDCFNFKDPSGGFYDMTGEQITVTFSDGSVISFTPIWKL
jgi:prepilin-type N-terminal cleavage/methylation domain-containing protein